MAWFDQVDLGFGSIQDQFSDLLGEASTLLETANKLDILNLDEMAVQEELTAALEEENEYEDEEVVHYNEHGAPTPDQDPAPGTPSESEPSPDEYSMYQPKGAHIHDDIAPIVESTADISMVDYASGYETSSPDRKPKPVEPLFSPMAHNTALDESYSWEGVEAMPAKPVKLASLTEHVKESSSMNVKTAAPVNSQFSITDDSDSTRPQLLPAKVAPHNSAEGTTKAAIKAAAKQSIGATAPLPSTNNNINAAPTGRKVKPLKPKPKSKELDFWGVNSKKALKFPDAASKSKESSSTATHSSASAGAKADTGSGNNTNKAAEPGAPDMFFGPVGLFGDDAYVSDFMEVDLEAATHSTSTSSTTHTHTHSGTADGHNSNTTATSTSSNSGGGHQQARLPMGWFSGMLSNTDGNNTYTSQHTSSLHSAGTQPAAPSFFDNLDSELPEEDPILKQVAYNKSNPHVQSESSPINKVLDMWNIFMSTEDPPSSVAGISGAESVLSNTATSTTKAPELYSTGTGPAWVVTVLTWFKNITGVTLIMQDAAKIVRYSGIIYTDNTSVFPNWAFLTVKLSLPVDNSWKSVLLFALHILRLVCICIFSIVVRVCICVYTILRYGVVYISGSGIGTGVVSARLRRYFANENVNTILGAAAPAEETWQQRAGNSIRQWATFLWEQLNSTNGIMVVTATLFIFSYFKFQRYGTDAAIKIREQFQAALYTDIQTCKFVAFDEEMTGIFSADGQHNKRDDTVEQRYAKMVHVATKYSIIQFGVCLFHDSEDGKALVATPYNFYVFPNSGPDLVVAPSSIDFLRKNKMNFDQWLSKGITYVDEAGEMATKNKFYPEVSTSEPAAPKVNIVLTKQSDIDVIEKNMALIEAMLRSNDHHADGTGSGDVVHFEPVNAYLRRVMYEQMESRFAGKLNIVKNDQNHLYVHRIDPDKQEEFELNKKLEKERQYNDILGFRRVFCDLVEAQKPIVGHNLFFDLLFMMRWFDAPLAPEFGDFRLRLHSKFPMIYDTKYIAALKLPGEPITDTALESCFNHFVKNRDGIEIKMSAAVVGYDANDAHYHNAGFDAYATGCVFARQLELLHQQEADGSASADNANNSSAETAEAEVKCPYQMPQQTPLAVEAVAVQVAASTAMEVDTAAGCPHAHTRASTSTATTASAAAGCPHLTALKNSTAACAASTGATTSILCGVELFPASVKARCCNIINMMRSFYHINLLPSKPVGTAYLTGLTLRVTCFDAKTTNNQLITKLLTDAGFELKTYDIIWVDNASLFLNFPAHELLDTTTTEVEGVPSAVSLTYSDAGGMASIVWPSAWKIETFAQYLRNCAAEKRSIAEAGDNGEGEVKCPALKKARVD